MLQSTTGTRALGARLLSLALAAALASGCPTWRRVEPTLGSIQEALFYGDTTRVVTHDGRRVPLRATDATEGALHGAGERTPVTIPFSDMARVERRVMSPLAKGVLLTVATAAVLVVALAIAGSSRGGSAVAMSSAPAPPSLSAVPAR